MRGHFPGNPIVPGALLLAEICARLAAAGLTMGGVRKVRFMRPVRPADVVEIDCRSDDNEQLRFECRVGDSIVARGIFIIAGAVAHD